MKPRLYVYEYHAVIMGHQLDLVVKTTTWASAAKLFNIPHWILRKYGTRRELDDTTEKLENLITYCKFPPGRSELKSAYPDFADAWVPYYKMEKMISCYEKATL